MCRRFTLVRDQYDGVNQPGIAAEGALFCVGKVVLCWVQPPRSVTMYDSMADVLLVQNQNGMTRLVWTDDREEERAAIPMPDRDGARKCLEALLGSDHVLVCTDSARSTRLEFARGLTTAHLHS